MCIVTIVCLIPAVPTIDIYKWSLEVAGKVELLLLHHSPLSISFLASSSTNCALVHCIKSDFFVKLCGERKVAILKRVVLRIFKKRRKLPRSVSILILVFVNDTPLPPKYDIPIITLLGNLVPKITINNSII